MESVSLEASLIQTREVELAVAQALAREKGIEQGSENKAKEIALRMLLKDIPRPIIADMTGLTLDEIAALLPTELLGEQR
ncbi:MAG: hypothetical protein K0S27_1153 [Gammaproteobacteria bacterium]|jgi:predicted transposase/invertase (TIGR01784 family)|nr:hypothetical protein [Gammaproteobacteria bacterium]